jgi:hypothetical protein
LGGQGRLSHQNIGFGRIFQTVLHDFLTFSKPGKARWHRCPHLCRDGLEARPTGNRCGFGIKSHGTFPKSQEKAMIFHVTLEASADGWIVAECPALPGCVSQGRDDKEALDNIKVWAEDQKTLANVSLKPGGKPVLVTV